MNEPDARDLFLSIRMRSLSGNPDALKVYELAHLAIAEADVEIARLKAELDAREDRPVLHATGDQCEKLIDLGLLDAEKPGTLLRSTDDRRTWERTADGWTVR